MRGVSRGLAAPDEDSGATAPQTFKHLPFNLRRFPPELLG